MTEPVRIFQSEDHLLHSDAVGDDLHLWIAPPVSGMRPATQPPVTLWVLDGDLYFGTVVETTRLMHFLFGELPPVLVVGVAYGAPPREQGEIRNRDLTPTADPRWEEMGRRMNPAWEPLLPEGRRMGRAPEFLRFLLEEARPYVESRFETKRGADLLFGASLGGLFAAWSLLAHPGAFAGTIAVSPSLWWDDDYLFGLEERVAAEGRDLTGRLFLAVGSEEEPESMPFVARFRLISNTLAFAERLTACGYPSLDVTVQVIEGETHTSVVAPALTRGLRALLAES